MECHPVLLYLRARLQGRANFKRAHSAPSSLQSNDSITPSITMAGMPGPVNAFYCGRQKLDCSCASLLGVCMTLQKISCEDARACRDSSMMIMQYNSRTFIIPALISQADQK